MHLKPEKLSVLIELAHFEGISRHRSNVELLVGHKATKGNDQT